MPRYVVINPDTYVFPTIRAAQAWAALNLGGWFEVAMVVVSSSDSTMIKDTDNEHIEYVRRKNQLRREVEEEIAIKLFGRGLK